MAISSNLFSTLNPYADGVGSSSSFQGFSQASLLDDLAQTQTQNQTQAAPPANPVDSVAVSHGSHSHHKPVHGRTHVS